MLRVSYSYEKEVEILLQRYDAVRFIKILESGRTRPLLLECECISSDDHALRKFVVKAPGLPEVGEFGLFSEMFSCLLANELEIGTHRWP